MSIKKQFFAIILLVYCVNIVYCNNKNNNCKLKNIIKPGMPLEIIEKKCINNGWENKSFKSGMMKGFKIDTITIDGKDTVITYNTIRKLFINKLNNEKLLVRFRKCGTEYILYRYCFTKKDIKSTKHFSEVLYKSLDNSEIKYKGIYKSDCEPSIYVRSRRDTIVDSLLDDFMRISK